MEEGGGSVVEVLGQERDGGVPLCRVRVGERRRGDPETGRSRNGTVFICRRMAGGEAVGREEDR